MKGLAAKANEDRLLFGIGLTLLAYFVFSCIDTSSKWLSLAGLPVIQLAFMRYFAHVGISTATLMANGKGGSAFNAEKLPLVIARGALLCCSTVLNFFAITYIPLTLTSTILFSAPLLVCALSWPMLGERVGIWRWSAIMLGFVGLMVAVRPFDESFHWAVILSFSAASCFAVYTILTRKLAGLVAVDTMNFYAGIVGGVVLLPFAVLSWTNPATALDWVLMFLLGVFGWAGHMIYTRAHSFADASALSPFAYAFIVFVAVWSFLVFDHLPDRWTIIGAAIIVVAGLVIWGRERHLRKG